MDKETVDKGNVAIVSHILIKDKDSQKVLVNKRDLDKSVKQDLKK